MNRFVNRETELEFLNKKYKEGRRQLIVVYGRRRIGKTELLIQFVQGKSHLYFLADKRGTTLNAVRFAREAAALWNDLPPSVSNFDEVFEYLVKRVGKRKRFIVIIDEFSYLVEKDSSIPSVFQLIWDNILKNTNFFLILCGSSLSMMHKGVLSYKSPLYGRRTGDWELSPLKFKEVLKFFPGISLDRAIEVFSVFGNIPAYLKEFSPKISLFENIKSKILTKGSVLYREPEILLREELREPASYLSILEAMGKNAKLSEIASASGVPAKDLPKYLAVLQKQLKIIEKKIPMAEKSSKKSLYYISDWFFKFWFRFVFFNLSKLEEGRTEEVLEGIKKQFASHVSFAFEEVCRQVSQELFPTFQIGSWWGAYREQDGTRKTVEIDIVGLNSKDKEILLGECKWQEKVNAQKLLAELRDKARGISWFKSERKEKYVLFAKSFAKKTKEAHLVDLKSLRRVVFE